MSQFVNAIGVNKVNTITLNTASGSNSSTTIIPAGSYIEMFAMSIMAVRNSAGGTGYTTTVAILDLNNNNLYTSPAATGNQTGNGSHTAATLTTGAPLFVPAGCQIVITTALDAQWSGGVSTFVFNQFTTI